MFVNTKAMIVCRQSMGMLFTKPHYWCSFLLEAVVFGLNGKKLYEYAMFLREPLNIFDIFLYTLSDIYMVILLVLGCLLLFSDMPFLNGMNRYVLLRVGKKEYFRGKFLYILCCSLLYFLQGFGLCLIYGCSNQICENAWSIPIYELAKNFKVGNIYFQLQGYPYAILQIMRPLSAFIINVLLVWLYSIILVMMLYGFSLIVRKQIEFIVVIMFHLSGLLFLMHRNFYFWLSQAMLEYHSFGRLHNGPTVIYSIGFYIVLIICSILFVERRFFSYEE